MEPTTPDPERHTPLAIEEAPQADLRDASRRFVGCPICGSAQFRLVCSAEEMAAQRRYLTRFYRRRWRTRNAATAEDRLTFTQDYTTNIVACLGCGLLYRNPRPKTDAIEDAYRAERYDDAYLQAEYENQRAWAREKIPALRRQLAGRVHHQGAPRILEVGSFVGGFLAEGLAAGWDMYGVDPGDQVTEFCRTRQLPLSHGTLEEVDFAPASFDAVVIWNTFDQLPDPHPTLTRITQVLRNGGVLVIRVPNGACYAGAMGLLTGLPKWLCKPLLATLAWNNLLTFPYLYGYSTQTLTALAEGHGFRRVACRPDTLLPVPADQPKLWARLEERCCQWLCRLSWQAAGASERFRSAPWLDLYFERAAVDDDSAEDRSLGLIPVYAPIALSHTSLQREGRHEGGGR